MNATTALAFGVLALALTGPVPALLSRAQWPYRSPRAALVLWQAIALAAVLSAFSSGLAIASQLLVPGPDGRPTTEPTAEIDALGLPLWVLYIVVFGLTLLIGAKLIFSIVRVAVHTRRRRARHRMLVDLLDRGDVDPSSALGGFSDVRVLDAAEPIAYCLPGLRQRVVVSEGALNSLGHAEVTAILTHERSHLRARHDLVLEAFTAVHEAFPRVVRSKSALGSVQLLVELLADDSAVKVTGPAPLARALVTCAGSTAPRGAMAVGGPSTLVRVQRLTGTAGDVRITAAAYLTAAAILVVPTIAVAVPWLVELSRLFSASNPDDVVPTRAHRVSVALVTALAVIGGLAVRSRTLDCGRHRGPIEQSNICLAHSPISPHARSDGQVKCALARLFVRLHDSPAPRRARRPERYSA